jgi:hypothetical protein
MSGFTMTWVRTIVTVVSLLRLTLIDGGAPSSRVSAYSTTAARGGRKVAISVAAGEDIARCTIVLCAAVMAVAAGVGTKMWFELEESGVISTPCVAAALVTVSAFLFGTDHISAFVRLKDWTMTSPASRLIDS